MLALVPSSSATAPFRPRLGGYACMPMATSTRIDARSRVFAILADRGALSRADLARQAALAPSTVSAVVSELQSEGLVVDAEGAVSEPARALPGRPPQLIALHRRAGVAL